MPDWQSTLGKEKQKPYFIELMERVAAARQQGVTVYPPQADVFNALKLTPLDQVKVVILGQDPYHGPNQAHGLCFSVQKGVPVPPSLKNIYKELISDVDGFAVPDSGDLTSWAQQGVLLLNTVLTVEAGKAHSHANWGWETFTDAVINAVNENTDGVVFMLWGSHAQKKGKHVNTDKHDVLTAPHPSPLSAHRGFFGCGHFSKANDCLVKRGKGSIDWHLPK